MSGISFFDISSLIYLLYGSRFSYRTTTNMNGSHDVLSSRFDVHGPEQRAVSRKSIMESHVITPRSFDGSTHAQKQDSYRFRLIFNQMTHLYK